MFHRIGLHPEQPEDFGEPQQAEKGHRARCRHGGSGESESGNQAEIEDDRDRHGERRIQGVEPCISRRGDDATREPATGLNQGAQTQNQQRGLSRPELFAENREKMLCEDHDDEKSRQRRDHRPAGTRSEDGKDAVSSPLCVGIGNQG